MLSSIVHLQTEDKIYEPAGIISESLEFRIPYPG